MGAVAFDTHKVVKDLKRAGFNDEQTEAVVSAVGEAVGENVATKADLELVATKTDIQAALEPYATKADLRTTLEPYATKADIQETKAEIYRAIWIQTGAIIAAVAALLRLFR